MNIFNVKLRSGEELIANVIDEKQKDDMTFILFEDPLEVKSSEDGSLFARDWLYFSKTNVVWIPVREIMYMNEGNQYAEDYFVSFKNAVRENEEEMAYSEYEYTDEELEGAKEFIDAYLKSKGIMKH